MSSINNDKGIYNETDIQRYLNGQLSAGEMNALEKAAMEDPFLADAIEGYGNKVERGEADIAGDLVELRALLKKRTGGSHKSIIPFYKTSWWKVAAIVLLLAGSGTVIYNLTVNSATEKTVIAKNNTMDEKAILTDSSPAVASGLADTIALKEAENRQAVAAPGQAPEPLKKSASPATSLEPASPAVSEVPPENNLSNILERKDAPNDLASASETERRVGLPDKQIKAGRKPEADYKTKPVKIFSGKVVNQHDQPVSNAAISVQSNKIDTGYLTDSNGHFLFMLPDSIASVVINRAGYETAKINLQGNRINNDIKLKSANPSLNEVAVTGYGTAKKRSEIAEKTLTTFQEAAPLYGIDSFNHYIEINKKLPAQQIDQHGKVVVSFSVGKKGELSNFKIVKSLSPSLDEEAIRLIKEGPPWKVLKDKKTTASITINF